MSDLQPQDGYVWRRGVKIAIQKAPNKYTIKLRNGVDLQEVSEKLKCSTCKTLDRQRLTEVEMDDTRSLEEPLKVLREESGVQFASSVYHIQGDPKAVLYPTEELTIQFKPGTSNDEITAFAEEFGLIVIKEVKGLAHAWVMRLSENSDRDSVECSADIEGHSVVQEVEPNLAIEIENYHTPTDTKYPEQWHLNHNGGPQLSENSHVHAEAAWDVTRGDRDVVVAIIDDSVDLFHTDFDLVDKIVAPRDFQGRDFDPQPEFSSDNHGTSCAGVAVAEENGEGVVGVAPECSLMPVRMSGFLDDNSIEELFEWALDNGADVLSCSWGPAAVRFPLSLRQAAILSRVANEGRDGKGAVICFASGNANRPINDTVDERGWPNNVISGPTEWVDGFAVHESVIAVAATTSMGKKAAYSNWGKEISVCAPSSNGHPGFSDTITYPRITSPILGRGILTTDRVGGAGYSTSDYTYDFGGTSSACPLVAGVAALVISANPDLTGAEVREILETTADKITQNETDPQLGNNFGTYDANGHSQWFGYGKVNAARAVAEARRRLTDPGEEPQQLAKSASPNVPIPDNNTTGISDTLSFDSSALISGVKVGVDVEHSYIGDLKLTLVSPDGIEVVLQNRRGGRADNIKKTFDMANTMGLSSLLGRSAAGDWKMLVQDFAPLDTGIFKSWSLEFNVKEDSSLNLVSEPGKTIPDNDRTGIEDSIQSQVGGTIQSIEVLVDITHTYIGDLSVSLFSPAGTEVILHNREGGPLNNIVKNYSGATTTALNGLKGETIQGTWRLKVIDNAGADVGKLNKWSLRIQPTSGIA